MFGRIVLLAGGMAAAAIGLATIASRMPVAAGDADGAVYVAEDNWTSRSASKGSPITSGPRTRGEMQIERAGDTHFYADTEIDGHRVRMMVDSGASMIALTRADAEAIGINVDALPEAGFAETAGGRVPVRPVMLDSVTVGNVEVRQVQAAVVDAGMTVSLLGQSFLARLDAVQIEGDRMTLR